MIKFFGNTSMSKLLTLLKAQFNTKVDKVEGKGLSTKDFTAELETKLKGIEAGANKYVHATHDAHASGFYKVTVDSEGHVTAVTAVAKADITALGIPGQDTTYTVATASKDGLMSKSDFSKLANIAENANNYTHPDSAAGAQSSGLYKITTDAQGHVTAVVAVAKSDITALGIPGALTPLSTNIETDSTSDAKAATPKAVKTYVDAQVSSTFKPAGSVATVDALGSLTKANVGKVYNISAEFTTTDSFIEGAGKKYPAGTNVVIVNPTGTTYQYDVLAGFIDLSPYAKTADFAEYTETEVQSQWDAVFTA